MTRTGLILLPCVLLLSPIVGLDWTVQHAVQRMRTPVLEPAMRLLTDAGRPATVFGALLGIAVLGGPAGVETARLALLTAAPANLAVETLKRVVGRTRPDGEQRRSNASFPSSHAANAFALAAVFARRRKRLAWAFWLLAALVGFSRIYLNRHFLSDVAAGAAIGIACAWAAARLWSHRSGGKRA
jgi:undecaprenyl-diphosphatase